MKRDELRAVLTRHADGPAPLTEADFAGLPGDDGPLHSDGRRYPSTRYVVTCAAERVRQLRRAGYSAADAVDGIIADKRAGLRELLDEEAS